jgi:ABC-2 type transport system ATP-binding protein
MSMLCIEGLTKTYKNAATRALDHVDFSVGEGAFVALLGPNGAGKSTLINILSGRSDPDSGKISLFGQDLDSRHPKLRTLIGIVPQEIRFDFVFTVEEVLRMELGFYGLRSDEARISTLLERLSLADKRRIRMRSLSGGMQRRLMIARALVHSPKLLLLDEPTAGVDLNLRRDLYTFLRELNDEGLSIVLTTHYLEEAEQLCDRIVVLDQGRVIADESRDDFLKMAGDFFTLEIRTEAGAQIQRLFNAQAALSMVPAVEGLRFVFQRSERENVLQFLSKATPHIDSFQILKPRLEDVFRKLTDPEGSLAH